MDLTPMLEQIRAAGVELGVRAGRLHCRAPKGVLTPRRKAWLERHKPELVELLRDAPPDVEPEPPVEAEPPLAPVEPEPIRWIDMPDVITVVEDLADEGMRPGQISRLLGLRRDEVATILRRSGR